MALFHHHTLRVALTGLAAIVIYKIAFTGFKTGPGVAGFVSHLGHEWVILANLLCLLMGFALLSRHFEKSHVPVVLPKFLPHDWKGGFVLLVMVWVLSSFLDNIAGALIGGAMAHQLFRAQSAHRLSGRDRRCLERRRRLERGGRYHHHDDVDRRRLAGASSSRRSSPRRVALFIFGIPAAIQQQKYSPILQRTHEHTHVDWMRVGIVASDPDLRDRDQRDREPEVHRIWPTIFRLSAWPSGWPSCFPLPCAGPDWEVLPETFKGSIFLLALVLCASMMPVEKLPAASWQTAFGLGFLSAVFDNIPLTALALKQGGYDWGFLAYAVGFGGSMIWFGSSAGVALTNLFPEGRSVGQWLRHGWWIAVAYVVGFFVMLAVWRWHPDAPH